MILMVRASFDDRVVKSWPAPLPHEIGDIFEVREDGRYVNSLAGCGAVRDQRPGRAHGKWTTYQIHVPAIPASRMDLMMGQERFEEPEWLRDRNHSECARPKAAEAWVRGCWLDLDALDDRRRLSLEQTGHCWLTRWEAEAIFHTMMNVVSADLSRHADGG